MERMTAKERRKRVLATEYKIDVLLFELLEEIGPRRFDVQVFQTIDITQSPRWRVSYETKLILLPEDKDLEIVAPPKRRRSH